MQWMEGVRGQGVKVSTQSVPCQNTTSIGSQIKAKRPRYQKTDGKTRNPVPSAHAVSFDGSHHLTSFSHQFLSEEIKVNYSGWVSLDRANTAAGGKLCLEKQHGESRR